MKRLMVVAAMAAVAFAAAADSVTVTGARQRWPWNGIVDIDFTLSGAAGRLYRIEATATTDSGTKSYCASTFAGDPVFMPGENRVSWNFGADYPGVAADDLTVSLAAHPADMTDAYCVIDISAGPDAAKYPVRYTYTPPAHVRGATNEACQLTEIWLKRIRRGKLPYQATNSGPTGLYEVRFSHDFYICIFEITQRQWYQVTGKWPSTFSNPLYRDARPVETVGHDAILGQHNWPDDKTVSADSFVGRIRARTGLTTFTLPTEAQYEYAERAGTCTTSTKPSSAATVADYANYLRTESLTTEEMAAATTEKGTIAVGSLVPNDWGLYDICGNVREWVLDTYIDASGNSSGNDLVHFYADEIAANGYVLDPEGPPNSTSGTFHPATVWRHALMGGYYKNSDHAYLWPYKRYQSGSSSSETGCRCVINCED